MRGKVFFYVAAIHGFGITPAYAGKSSEDTRRSGTNGDHPRVCGEKSFENGVKGYFEGSPPRMRGKVSGSHPYSSRTGITPAYAGKSGAVMGWPCCARDHPRVCGEKRFSAVFQRAMSGSPPRMRGKEDRVLRGVLRVGITPAYAGKSFMWTKFCRETRDHPRVCGEKGKNHPRKPYCEGLPPRVRGKVALHHIQR